MSSAVLPTPAAVDIVSIAASSTAGSSLTHESTTLVVPRLNTSSTSSPATVKSNEVKSRNGGEGEREWSSGSGTVDARTSSKQDQGKDWPGIRSCNYTYQSDPQDGLYVTCLNHESGSRSGGGREEGKEDAAGIAAAPANAWSREQSGLHQLQQQQRTLATARIMPPDLSIFSSADTSSSYSSTTSSPATSVFQSTTATTANAATTSVSRSNGSTTAASGSTEQTSGAGGDRSVTLHISGYDLASLSGSLLQPLLIDLLDNNNNSRSSNTSNNKSAMTEQSSSRITCLILSNNSIKAITGDSFASVAASLRQLDLSRNLIRDLKPETFDALLPILSILNLSHNLLQSIDFLSDAGNSSSNNVSGSSALTHLDLSHNRLRVIRESCFAMHSLLTDVDLSSNEIESLDAASFVPLTRLSRLDLSDNPLANHGHQLLLSSMSHLLHEIKLSNSSIGPVIPGGIDPFVRRLILSRNHVSQVCRGDLENHNSLSHLDLSHNQISDMEEDALGRLKSLTELRLDHNLLQQFPVSLPRRLRRLLLSQNSICSLSEDAMSSLTQLQSLDLEGNQLTSLHPRALTGLAQLVSLNLSGNRLSSLPPLLFQQTPALLVLDISHNPIMHLSADAFSGLTSLCCLSMSYVPANESMIKIDSDALRPLISVRSIDLSHSPLLLRALLQSLSSASSSLVATSNSSEESELVYEKDPLHYLTSVEQINVQFDQLQELQQHDWHTLHRWTRQLQDSGSLSSISLQEEQWKCEQPSILWLIKWITSLPQPHTSFASSCLPSSSSSSSSSSSFSTNTDCCHRCYQRSSAFSASDSSPSSTAASSSTSAPPSSSPSSSSQTMAASAANSSSRTGTTWGSQGRLLMHLTSPSPPSFSAATPPSPPSSQSPPTSAPLASSPSLPSSSAAGDRHTAAAEATASEGTLATSPLPSLAQTEDRTADASEIRCSSPEHLRGRTVSSLKQEELGRR